MSKETRQTVYLRFLRSMAVLLALVCCLAARKAYADPTANTDIHTSKDGAWEFVVNDDGTATITKYNGYLAFGHDNSVVAIPPDGDAGTVTDADGTAYNVIKVESPTDIGVSPGVFRGHDEIETVFLFSELQELGDNTFYGCSNLSEVVVQDDYLKRIGDSCFAECAKLTSFEVPGNVTYIGDHAFSGCKSLATISFMGVYNSEELSIQARAFEDCTSLTEVNLPPNLAHMQGSVFSGCSNLECVLFSSIPNRDPRYPDHERYVIVSDLLAGCDKLATLVIPEGWPGETPSQFGTSNKVNAIIWTFGTDGCATIAGYYDFQSKATSVKIPSVIGPYSVTGIGTQAFELDQYLETIEFDEGTQITTIGDRAFSRCAKLRNIELPASVTSLGVECFLETPTDMDTSLRTDPIRNTSITTLPDGCFYLSSLPGSIKLPDGVTRLGDRCFMACKGMTSLELPDSVTRIGAQAFADRHPCYLTIRMPDMEDQQLEMDDSIFDGIRWDDLYEDQDFLVRFGSVAWELVNNRYNGNLMAVDPVDLSDKSVSVSVEQNLVYDGTPKLPAITVRRWKYFLTQRDNYHIDDLQAITDAGDHTATIVADSFFKGTRDFTISIAPADFTGKLTMAPIPDCTWDGVAWTPKGPWTYPKLDGTNDHPLTSADIGKLTYTNNTDAERDPSTPATVTIGGTGNFTGTQTFTFHIVQRDLSTGATISKIPDQTYSGSEIKPTPDVKIKAHDDSTITIKASEELQTPTYANNKNVGTATVTYKAKQNANVTGSISTTFKIVPKAVTVTANNATKTYGDARDPNLTAKVDGCLGTDTVEYSLSRKKGEDVGTYAINPSGEALQGNYAVSFVAGTLTINPRNITEATIGEVEPIVFDGTEHKPKPKVTFGGKTLQEGKDYTLRYSNNTHAGKATVHVVGKGNFTGQQDAYFTIAPYDISSSNTQVGVGFQLHTGEPLEPEPAFVHATLTDDRVLELNKGDDYTIVGYNNNVGPGTGTVTIEGCNDYTGQNTGHFEIIEDGRIEDCYLGTIHDQTYTGSPIEPTFRVYLTGVDLYMLKDVDYAVTFENNVNAGDAHVSITGLGIFEGTGKIEGSFTILPASIEEAQVSTPPRTYDGTPLEAQPTVRLGDKVLEAGVDYKVAYNEDGFAGRVFAESVLAQATVADRTNAGTVDFSVVGQGNYTGSVPSSFEIKRRSVALATPDAQKVYDGFALTCPDVVVGGDGWATGEGATYKTSGSQTVPGATQTQFSYQLQDGTSASNYNITTSFGTLTVEGRPKNKLFSLEVVSSSATATYDGQVHVASGFKALSFDVASEAGTFPVQVEGLTSAVAATHAGAYPNTTAGTAVVRDAQSNDVTSQFAVKTVDGTLSIEAADLSDKKRFSFTPIADVSYTGRAQEPKVQVKDTVTNKDLVEGKDFTVAYDNNVNPGTAKATLTGIGNYTGARDVTFRIVDKTQATTSQSSHNGSQAASQGASQSLRTGAPRTADGNMSPSVLQALFLAAAACFITSRKQRR